MADELMTRETFNCRVASATLLSVYEKEEARHVALWAIVEPLDPAETPDAYAGMRWFLRIPPALALRTGFLCLGDQVRVRGRARIELCNMLMLHIEARDLRMLRRATNPKRGTPARVAEWLAEHPDHNGLITEHLGPFCEGEGHIHPSWE